MKVYIAGPLCTENERKFVEEIDKLCKKLNLETFLPHRDCGLWKNLGDTKRIAKGDIEGFKNCKLLIANMNGFYVSSGTAWEMGYAYAKKIPIIGIKTDKKPEDSVEDISAIIFGTTKITRSFEELERELKKILWKND